MTSRPQPLRLADDLPAATPERWRELVDAVLARRAGPAGREAEQATSAAARFEATMVSRTGDGIAIQPLYDGPDLERLRAAGWPGGAPFVRGRRPAAAAVAGWEVCQRVDPGPAVPGAGQSSPGGAGLAVAEVAGGATALWVPLVATRAGDLEEALEETLAGIDLGAVPIRLEPAPDTDPGQLVEAVVALRRRRGVEAGRGRASLGMDPFGQAAARGPRPRSGDLGGGLGLAVAAAGSAAGQPALRSLVADGLAYQQAGASEGQELGCALATGVAYVRALVGAGLDVDRALGQLEVRLAATTDQFLTIAKLRAGRRLWARVGQVLGAAPDAGVPPQHAVTSPAMLTAYSPWSNLVRTTIACFAAGAGGADAVTVVPHDWVAAGGRPGELGRRLARDVQLLLLEEAHVARVVDPAGGSGYVEALTEELARAAWAWFQEIEGAGGMAAALASGLVEDRVGAAWQARAARLATGAEIVTGVNDRADLDQPLPPALAGGPPAAPAGLAPRRAAGAFEAQRARADRHLATCGERPAVVLAGLGDGPGTAAGAELATTILGLGGLVPTGGGPLDLAGAARALRAGRARVACLCPGVDAGPEDVASAARTLRGAGAARVLLAGRPGPVDGVDEVVHPGADRLGVISRALDAAGVL